MYNNTEEYYNLLGVSENSSISDIKKAFRNKAKIYHPDKNNDSSSEQQFIAITEAYQYLIQYKKGNIVYEDYKTNQTTRNTEEELRDKARAQAKAYAKMRYEEFLKSDFYKNDQAFLVILNHLQFFLSLLFVTLPIILISHYLLNSKITGAVISLILAYFWQKNYKKHVDLDIENLKNALSVIFKIKAVKFIISITLNLFLFTSYTLQSQINTSFIVSIFLITNVALYILLGFVKSKKIIYLIFPLTFNLFFTLNYTFSKEISTESYLFKHKYSSFGGGRPEKTSSIILEKNEYNNYPLFRFFLNFKKMENKNKIVYQFEKGCFGVRVLKDYEFTY